MFNLLFQLLEILETYSIKKEQVYTITCDNAANMVKLARIVNEIPEMCVMTENELDGDNNDSFDDDQSDIYINEGEPLSCIDIENELKNCKQPTNGMLSINNYNTIKIINFIIIFIIKLLFYFLNRWYYNEY